MTPARQRARSAAFQLPEDSQAVLAFSDRATGNVSATVGPADGAARQRLAGLVGAEPGALVFMEQVHGGSVAVVDRQARGRGRFDHADAIPGVDALVTFATGVILVVVVADCIPLLLIDPGRSVAAVHAGRAGLMADVIAATLHAMRPRDPALVRAVLGPGIGGCCYEVPESLASEVAAAYPAAAATTRWGTTALDVGAAAEARLHDAGLQHVTRSRRCTRCDERLYSHRRAPGAGRQAGVIWRRPAAVGAPTR